MERGSDIVRLQDLNIFAGIPSTPVAFLEPDFEMKDCIFSLVIGLKSKGMGVGMLEVILALRLELEIAYQTSGD